MLIFEAKLEGTEKQYRKLDECIRASLFIRNKCIRYWMDNPGKKIGRFDLSNYVSQRLSKEFVFSRNINSQAREASADRAWNAISRFYQNCKKGIPGKKGYPKFKKDRPNHGSYEYKTSGWELSSNRKFIRLKGGCHPGRFKMWGTRNLHFYQLKQIKRVRVVRRADGYYVQFVIDADRNEKREPTGKSIGLDVGLNHFYTDSDGQTVENPRHLRKSEKTLKRLQRRLAKTKKGSNNRKKAINRLARKHLKVSRQRKDFAVKLARCVVQSNDLVAYEDLKVSNMVKNHKLAKSISDAAWSTFRHWVEYFGKVFGVVTVAVPPQYTSQNCSNCGEKVKKSLSMRTHRCNHCGFVIDRDWNAAINILKLALRTVGHTETHVSGDIDLCIGEETPQCKSSRRKRKSKQ